MITYVIFGVTYGFIAAVQPGPLQTYIISQTLKKGWRSTLPASFAPIISDIPIFFLVMFLLTKIPDDFLFVLRILGGLFLLYLSYRTFLSWKEFNETEVFSEKGDAKTLFSAVTVNLLNPNPYIGWSLIMGPIFLEGWNSAPLNGISLIISFYLTMVVILSITIILFAFARQLGPKVSKILLGLSGLALLFFALYQLAVGTGVYS